MAINKVVLNDVVKLDLTGDTVTADKLSEGITAHDAAGNPVTGTMVATTPTLTVSTNAGAAVTATKGSLSVSGTADSSGSCVLELPEFGEWTIVATDGNATNTKVVIFQAEFSCNSPLNTTISVSGRFNSSSYYSVVDIDGTEYRKSVSLTVDAGTTVTVYVAGSTLCTITLNGVEVQENYSYKNYKYSFETSEDTSIVFSSQTEGYTVYYCAEITTASYDTSAAVASIMLGEEIV